MTQSVQSVSSNETPRRFLPGSEWIYFKIYCDSKVSDELLVRHLAPVVQNLKGKGLIDKWFFIRFRDPESHIRIRLHATNASATPEIIASLQEILQSEAEQRIIWNVKLDTYSRELERYGPETIDIAEDIFFIDSETALELLKAETNFQWNVKQWLLALRNIHLYFTDFQLT